MFKRVGGRAGAGQGTAGAAVMGAAARVTSRGDDTGQVRPGAAVRDAGWDGRRGAAAESGGDIGGRGQVAVAGELTSGYADLLPIRTTSRAPAGPAQRIGPEPGHGGLGLSAWLLLTRPGGAKQQVVDDPVPPQELHLPQHDAGGGLVPERGGR